MRMRAFSGLRRLRLVGCRSRGWAGPWGRQSRTYGPGRRPPHRYHRCVARPSAHVGPKGLPTPESTRRVSCRTSLHTVAPRPVGARSRAISQQGGDAVSLAGPMCAGTNGRWHAMKPDVHPEGAKHRRCAVTAVRGAKVTAMTFRRPRPLRSSHRASACRASARNGVTASLAFRAQARSYRAKRAYQRFAACFPASDLIVGCAGGQALGADMSGGPPGDSRFAIRVPMARSEGPRLADPRA